MVDSMGLQVERPIPRKEGVWSLLEATPTKAAGQGGVMDHVSWQWGAFENSSSGADELMDHPTRFNCADAATLAESPDASTRHLTSPPTPRSSPVSPSSPLSATSPTYRGGCVDSFGGNVNNHRRLRKQREEKGVSPMLSSSGEFRPSRWDSGRWQDGHSFGESSSSRSRGNGVCKCAAGVTTDVAVVCCCCPFALLHLLAVAFFKLPAAAVAKTMRNFKHKMAAKKKRAAATNEEDENTTPASSCPPSRCRSYEAKDTPHWAPALGFGDWRDFFDSPDAAGVWGDGELRRGNGEELRGKS